MKVLVVVDYVLKVTCYLNEQKSSHLAINQSNRQTIPYLCFLFQLLLFMIVACAAARRAIGTR